MPSVGLLSNYVNSKGEWHHERQNSFEGKNLAVSCIGHVSQNSSFSALELRWRSSSILVSYFVYLVEDFEKFKEKIISHSDGSPRRIAIFRKVMPFRESDCTASQPEIQYSAGTRCLAPTFGRRQVKWKSISRYSLTERREGGVAVCDSLFLSFMFSFFHSFMFSFFLSFMFSFSLSFIYAFFLTLSLPQFLSSRDLFS